MSLSLEGARFTKPPEPLGAPAERAAEPHGRDVPHPFERILHRLGAEIDRGEAVMGAAARGHYESMDAATLIALQAGIYRYSEAVDLTVKLVDRAASAAKTILEGGR